MDPQEKELTGDPGVPGGQSNEPMTEEEMQYLIARVKEADKKDKRQALTVCGLGILGVAFYYLWRLLFYEIISVWFIRLDILSIGAFALGIIYFFLTGSATKTHIEKIKRGERATIK